MINQYSVNFTLNQIMLDLSRIQKYILTFSEIIFVIQICLSDDWCVYIFLLA